MYFISGANGKAGHRHAGFSYSAATKQARGAGAGEQARGAGDEYDGVSVIQQCYLHEYIFNLSEHEQLSRKCFAVKSFVQYIGVVCSCKKWEIDHFQLDY